ncbi:MAG TPA: RNA polymerase sigma factor [Thermoanaerobaculia bacterium]|nr:RNA polymerase sigma factor [Thermoanaerobaculia bacterium]
MLAVAAPRPFVMSAPVDETLRFLDSAAGPSVAAPRRVAGVGDIVNKPDFDTIWRELYARVVYFFERRGLSREDAQDLAQETFLRVQSGLDDLRAGEAVHSWVFTIATNLFRNRLRFQNAERRRGSVVSFGSSRDDPAAIDPDRAPQLAQEPDQERSVLAGENVEGVREAIALLPERMRQTCLLRFGQNRSYQEISVLMGVSVQGVKSQIHQARQRLRKIIEARSGPRTGGEGSDER